MSDTPQLPHLLSVRSSTPAASKPCAAHLALRRGVAVVAGPLGSPRAASTPDRGSRAGDELHACRSTSRIKRGRRGCRGGGRGTRQPWRRALNARSGERLRRNGDPARRHATDRPYELNAARVCLPQPPFARPVNFRLMVDTSGLCQQLRAMLREPSQSNSIIFVWGWAAKVVDFFFSLVIYQRGLGTPLSPPSIASGSSPSICRNTDTKSIYTCTVLIREGMAEVAAAAGVGKVLLKCLLSGAKTAVEDDNMAKQAARRDLPFLKEELAAMQSFLMAADDVQIRHKVPTTEVKRVRILSYDVEDCIQDATVHLEKSYKWQPPHTMREEMKRLRAQVEDMGQRSLRYHIAKDSNSRSATSATISGDRARHSAGSDKSEVSRMVQLINSEDRDLRVIAVWGTSGNLEQTSIMREAYENPDIIEKFSCRAWVRVMQPFNPIEFVQSLVRQFQAAEGVDALLEAEKTAQQLAQEFNEHVTKKGYLIVLNDLNTIEEWDRIKTCFPDNKKGSRIIVSTKQAEVASLSVGYQSVRLKLKELAADQILYAFHHKASQKKDGDDRGSSLVALQRCRTMALSGQSYLVGRGREMNAIIKLITSENSGQIISVWGARGIGKTTLVRDVYDSQELSGMFHTRAYVTVVRPFNLEELLKSLAMQLIAGGVYKDKYMVDSSCWKRKMITREQLMAALEKLLRVDGMRCLIVLDDVLSAEEWDAILRTPLGEKSNSTKIIVTTREEHIAKFCSQNTESMYMLKALEYEDGLDLFTAKVFGETIFLDQKYPQLVEQANLILRKCNGLPLSIVAIGALLAHKPKSESEWSKLNEHISAELEMNQGYMSIRTVLLTSYDYLPYHLKSFVLYLPIFPEGYKVRRRRLICRLTAEGYSKEVRGKSVEEIAEAYFMELISRGIILACELSVDSRKGIDSCKLHGIISEIAISKSREENLVLKLEEGCSHNPQDIVRHLAISSNWREDQCEFESMVNLSRLRSVTVFGKWRPYYISDKMRLLRVLDLEDTSGLVDHHLEHIGKLIHLRYLSLRGCGDIYHLPDSLGNLRLLESLDVKGTKVTKLPKTISKLQKLQHVIAGCIGADDHDINESMSEILPKLMRNKLGLMTVFSAGFCVACCAPHRMEQNMGIDGCVTRRDVCTICCCAMLPALSTRGSIGGVALPRGIRRLRALLTLGTVNLSGRRKSTLQEIARLTRLRKLGVAGINKRNGRELCSAVSNSSCLESLSVWSDEKDGLVGCLDGMFSPPEKLQSLKLYGRLGRVPDWIQGLQNLVKLKLRGSRLHQSDDDDDDDDDDDHEAMQVICRKKAMQVLGSLPNLAILILLEKSFEGEELHFSFKTEAFPSLLLLQLQSLDVVRRVEFEQGATPRLEVLRFGLSSDGDCRFYGLQHPLRLREVVLGSLGRDQEDMMKDVREQLARNPNRPVLRMGN